MRKLTNRRIRMAAIAATLAATAGVLSAPIPAFAATTAATAGGVVQAAADDEFPDTVTPEGAAGEGATEVLTVADDAELTASGYGKPIQRADVLERGINWYNRNIPYSQSATATDKGAGKRYRTDCSGFVSMAWKLKTSLTTRSLDTVSHVINWNDLLPGDALLKKGTHVQLFERWVDEDTKADFWIYEEGSTASDMNRRKIHVIDARHSGYEPYRYDSIRK
ncbi:hypothetical protein [Symbioplanes lichenis]|uniref:hypothetical protein n=1 Tax=Symbioplanes lichenis TaxID=1629072 RepID=UPI002739A6C0|nr:hypothetical protein [Actinoplanes lichenis]